MPHRKKAAAVLCICLLLAGCSAVNQLPGLTERTREAGGGNILVEIPVVDVFGEEPDRLPTLDPALLARKEAFYETRRKAREALEDRRQRLEGQYSYIDYPYDGLARVVKELPGDGVGYHRSGFLDDDDTLAIPLVWGMEYGTEYGIGGFSEGLAVVLDPETHLSGAINTQGEVVIPIEHQSLSDCSEGLVAAHDWVDGLPYTQYYNTAGNIAVPRFEGFGGDFSQGIASVLHPVEGNWPEDREEALAGQVRFLVSYIDRQGRVILDRASDIPQSGEREYSVYQKSMNGAVPICRVERPYTGAAPQYVVNRRLEPYRIAEECGEIQTFELPFVGIWEYGDSVVWLGQERRAVIPGEREEYLWAVVAAGSHGDSAQAFTILLQREGEEEYFYILWDNDAETPYGELDSWQP